MEETASASPSCPGAAGRAQQADAGDIEAQPGAHALEQGHVALPVAPEVEVVAHHHGPGVEATDQDLGHELLGRLGRPLGVEVQHDGEVGPRRGQQGQLLVEVGEQQRGRARAHHAGGVAVEGDHGGKGADLPGRRAGPVDEAPVAQVHAVEGPDGHHGAFGGTGITQVGQALLAAAGGVIGDLHRSEATGPGPRGGGPGRGGDAPALKGGG